MAQVIRVEARGAAVAYGKRKALQPSDLSVAAGTATVLVGPNGSGKSTLLRALAGRVALRAGRVLLDGHDVRVLRPRDLARKVALLAQNPPIPEGLTVRHVVEQGRYPHVSRFGMLRHQDHAAITEAIRKTDLSELEHRFVDELSGGERQRVWLALTLAQQAAVLLLDEPTTFLDLNHQLSTLALVDELRQTLGLTIVMVLHDLNQAAAIADTLVVLHKGSVVASGSPADVLDEGILAEVFGVRATIIPQPETRRPFIVPVGVAT